MSDCRAFRQGGFRVQHLDEVRHTVALVQADMTLTDDVVALYTAPGGGWQETVGTLPTPDIDEAPPIMPAAADSLAAASASTGTMEH